MLTPVALGFLLGNRPSLIAIRMMRRALLVLLSLLVSRDVWAQEATITDAPRATVLVVGSGVFVVPQGRSVYVEQHNNRILVAFPEKGRIASRNAYWPGPIGKREPCSELATHEYELVISGEPVCVRMGWIIDTWRSIGDGSLVTSHNGGCSIDLVRFEKRADTLYLVARADCTEVVPLRQ